MEIDENATARPDAIFIAAPLPRSGTNYLWELLRRHPECAPGRPPVWEDYLLVHAPKLVEYARLTQASWDASWGPTGHLEPELLRHLGNGLISFLSTDPRRRVVTKSPTDSNLDVFFDLFPEAYLLVLVRDGRDVAASGMKTFGWTMEEAARGWARGMDRVLDLTAARPEARMRLVRFEHLFERPEAELCDVLRWLHLDPDVYDFTALAEIPVRGSSSYRGDGETAVHWRPLPRPAGFRPIERWLDWAPAEIDAFERVAGPQLERLGYPCRGSTRRAGATV